MVEERTLAPVVRAIQALRGISLISAVTIMAELGDLARFENPRQLMGFLGLVPSERSTGLAIWLARPETEPRNGECPG